MLKNKIYRYDEINALFWPIALTMIFTSTLSFVDTIMIAHYDIYASTGISVVTNMGFLFGPIYFAVMTGVNIYSVQYYARNKTKELKHLAGIALTILFGVAVINFLIYFIFGDQIIDFLAPSEEISGYAIQYLSIFMFSVFLQPIDMFFIYQYRAIKKAKIPLKIGIFQSLMNIVLNLIFIYVLNLSVYGVGLSTLITRITVVIIHLFISKRLNLPFIGSVNEMFSYDFSFFKEVFKNTIPLMIVEFGFGFGNFIYFKLYALSGPLGLTSYNVAKSISFIINAFVIATANVSGIMIGSTIAQAKDKYDSEISKTMNGLFKFMFKNSISIILISVFVFPFIIPFFLYGNIDNTANSLMEYVQLIFTSQYFKITYLLILVNAIWMAIRVYASSLIAILKSGNDNKFILFVETASTYLVGIPITLIIILFLSKNNLLNDYSIIFIRLSIIFEVLSKVIIGYYRYKQNKWIRKV